MNKTIINRRVFDAFVNLERRDSGVFVEIIQFCHHNPQSDLRKRVIELPIGLWEDAGIVQGEYLDMLVKGALERFKIGRAHV